MCCPKNCPIESHFIEEEKFIYVEDKNENKISTSKVKAKYCNNSSSVKQNSDKTLSEIIIEGIKLKIKAKNDKIKSFEKMIDD